MDEITARRLTPKERKARGVNRRGEPRMPSMRGISSQFRLRKREEAEARQLRAHNDTHFSRRETCQFCV